MEIDSEEKILADWNQQQVEPSFVRSLSKGWRPKGFRTVTELYRFLLSQAKNYGRQGRKGELDEIFTKVGKRARLSTPFIEYEKMAQKGRAQQYQYFLNRIRHFRKHRVS
jgi:hypothetical protein